MWYDLFGHDPELAFPLRLQRPRSERIPALSEVRVSKTDEEFFARVDLPGVRKEDVEVTFDREGMLVVSKRKDLGTEFTHRCSLSDGWDRETAEATLADGVLTVKLKRLSSPKVRKVVVK